MTDKKLTAARRMYDAGELTVDAIAETVGVSRATIYRHLAPVPAKPAPRRHSTRDPDDVVAGAIVAAATRAAKRSKGR